jgi:hypothetical protein
MSFLHNLQEKLTQKQSTKDKKTEEEKELQRAAEKDIKSQSTIIGWYETKLRVAIVNARTPQKS